MRVSTEFTQQLKQSINSRLLNDLVHLLDVLKTVMDSVAVSCFKQTNLILIATDMKPNDRYCGVVMLLLPAVITPLETFSHFSRKRAITHSQCDSAAAHT